MSAKWIYELFDRECRRGDPDIGTYLRRKYKKKKSFKRSASADGHIIPNRVDIAERPAEVVRWETFGHWEADTVVGTRHQGAIVTLVDRFTRQGFCLLSRAAPHQNPGRRRHHCHVAGTGPHGQDDHVRQRRHNRAAIRGGLATVRTSCTPRRRASLARLQSLSSFQRANDATEWAH